MRIKFSIFCTVILCANATAGIFAHLGDIDNQSPGYVCEKNGDYWAEQQVPKASSCQQAGNYSEAQAIAVEKNFAAERDREAVEVAREKKWIARSPLLDKDGQ